MPVPCHVVPGAGTNVFRGTARTWPWGRKVPPVLMRKNGCHPSRMMRRNSQRASKPRSASTMTVHARGTARRTWRSMRNHSRRQACLAVAGRTVQATGMAQPRYTTLSAKTVKRVPKVVASRAKANGVPSHWATTQASQGTKQGSTGSAQRAVPRLAVASEQNSRNCWRTVGSLRCSQVAKNALTAVNAQERASTIPRLQRAKTVACGLLKWGKCAWMVSVHSVTRGWQDIRFLLGCMEYMAIHTTPEGRRILPLCIEGRNLIDSKTYPRKDRGRGSEAARRLLEQDKVTLLRSRPHRRHETAARAEHPGDLACGCGPVDDIHQAQRGQQHIERPR